MCEGGADHALTTSFNPGASSACNHHRPLPYLGPPPYLLATLKTLHQHLYFRESQVLLEAESLGGLDFWLPGYIII